MCKFEVPYLFYMQRNIHDKGNVLYTSFYSIQKVEHFVWFLNKLSMSYYRCIYLTQILPL